MRLTPTLRSFAWAESGVMTVLGLIFLILLFSVGGLAVDAANAYRVRTNLQLASDSIAHAALYYRQDYGPELAKAKALELLDATVSSSANGTVLTSDDIVFGTWDRATRSFTPDPNSKTAVIVNAGRAGERGNRLDTHMMGFVGVDNMDVRTLSVFETYWPPCLREGFVAEDIVDVQSNNTYTNGFCIHSQTHVEVNTDNSFAENTVVSMPDKSNLVLPASGFVTNDGLYQALRDRSYQIRILNRLVPVINDLRVAGLFYTPDYITDRGIDSVYEPTTKNIGVADVVQGRVNYVSCNGNQKLFVKDFTPFKEVVIVTNCAVKLGQGVQLHDAIIATTNTDAKSVYAPSSLEIGRNDHCATGGGAQVLTMGGVEVAADLKMFGGQIIAKGDVSFSANANGLEGASIISGGKISGTSNMTMGFCGSGMEDSFEMEYFRLAL